MKKFTIEAHEWNEVVPDDGIWVNTCEDSFEAENETEAVELYIDAFVEQNSDEEYTPNYDDGSVEWVNDDGYRCATMFRAVED